MQIHIHIHHAAEEKIDRCISMLEQLRQKVSQLVATLDETLAAVQEETTQVEGLGTLMLGIKAQLDDILAGKLTPAVQAKVDAIFDAVQQGKQKAIDAINAGTTPPTP